MSQKNTDILKDNLVKNEKYKAIFSEFKLKFLFGIGEGQEIDESFIASQFEWLMDQLGETKYMPIPIRLFMIGLNKLRITKGNLDCIESVKEVMELISLMNEMMCEMSEEVAGDDDQLKQLYQLQIKANLRSMSPVVRKLLCLPTITSSEVIKEIDTIIEEFTFIKNQHINKPETPAVPLNQPKL